MRRALAAAALVAGALAPATARASVDVIVAGKDGTIVSGPRAVSAAATRVRAGGRRCRVPAATPLAALAGLRRTGGPAFAVRDFGQGACDPLFVSRIGRAAGRGVAGWTYKVGHAAGTTAAADRSGPFGTGRRLRAGARVEWFWCRVATSCERTLAVAPARRSVVAGARLRVRVKGYDDLGRGIAVGGARVTLGRASARTGRDGVAVLTAPARRGAYLVRATRRGLAAGFPERVAVG